MKGTPKYKNKIPKFIRIWMLPQIINKQIRRAMSSTQLNLNTNSATQPTLIFFFISFSYFYQYKQYKLEF